VPGNQNQRIGQLIRELLTIMADLTLYLIPLDFTLSFGTVRGAVDEGDTQRGGGVGELMRTERGAIVEIDLCGQSPFA